MTNTKDIHELLKEFGTAPEGLGWDSAKLHDWQKRIEERLAKLEGKVPAAAVIPDKPAGKRISVNDKDGE